MFKFLIIFILSVLIITLPLVFKISLYYDIHQNIGYVKVELYFLTIYKVKISLAGFYIDIIKNNKKLIKIKFDANDKYVKFMKNITKRLKNKIVFINFENYNFISMDNAFNLSLNIGVINTSFNLLSSIIYNNNPNVKLVQENYFNFSGKKYETFLQGKLMITILDFIWSIILSIFIKKEKNNYERKRI